MTPILRDDSLPMGGFSRLVRGAAGPAAANCLQITDACYTDSDNPSTPNPIADDALVVTAAARQLHPSYGPRYLYLFLPEELEIKRAWVDCFCTFTFSHTKSSGGSVTSAVVTGLITMNAITNLNGLDKSTLTWNNQSGLTVLSSATGYRSEATLSTASSLSGNFTLGDVVGIKTGAWRGLGLSWVVPVVGGQLEATSILGWQITASVTGLNTLPVAVLDLYWQKMGVTENATTLLDSRPWMVYDLAE